MWSNVLLSSASFLVLLGIVSGRPGFVGERKVRDNLLHNYDKVVRPATGPEFIVQFGVKFKAIDQVEDKQQTITMKCWVVMKWNNTLLKWNISDYFGVDRAHFTPSEIWFPDIALYNNGNKLIAIAGGRGMFLSNVVCSNTGECIWSGAASFTASCDLDIINWPFDIQTCTFEFGSSSYDSQQLQLSSLNLPANDPEGNSNWEVDSLKVDVGETDHGECCPYKFAQITYTLQIKRLFDYQMFYIFGPCVILTILSLLSFWIPSESGERIGFVTTLLLSLMVYLLVVPESLPVSSKEIPVLGKVIMVTLGIISLVLLSTIIVLICFFRTDATPRWLRFLVSKPRSPPRTTPVQSLQDNGKSSVSLRAMQPSFTVAAAEEPIPPPPRQRSESWASQDDKTWQQISFKLDKIFFWVFLVSGVVIYVVLVATGARI